MRRSPIPLLLVAACGWQALSIGAQSAAAQEPLSWGAMQRELAARDVPGRGLRIPYGAATEQFGKLRIPEGPGPHPVAVVVHGGCWLSIAGLDYMEPLAAELNRLGWATWSLEFRRIDQAGGGWPGILEDVAAGADHLAELARDHPLDLGRVVTVGHSSGGHLALWLASRRRLPMDREGGPLLRGTTPLPVRGVVALAPIADLGDFTRYTRCGPTIVQDFLGGEGVDRDRLALSDPVALAPTSAPQLLIMGELDPIVPPAHGAAYRGRVAAAGQEVDLATVEGAGHFELVAPWTAPFRGVQRRMADFLGRVGQQDR